MTCPAFMSRAPKKSGLPTGKACPRPGSQQSPAWQWPTPSQFLPLGIQVPCGGLAKGRELVCHLYRADGSCRAQPASAQEEDPTFYSHSLSPWSAPWHQRPGRATHSSNTSVPLLSPLAGPAAPKCLDSHVPARSLSSQAGRPGRVEGTEENPHCSPAKWGCLDTSGQPVPDTEQPLFGPRCQPR